MIHRHETHVKSASGQKKPMTNGIRGTTPFQQEGDSFAERWRRRMEKKNPKDKSFLATLWFRGIMVFHVPTQLYVFRCFVIPHLFQDCSPWLIYYMNVIIWYIVIMMVSNWFCVILYDPSHHKTRDQPVIDEDLSKRQPVDYFTPRSERTTHQNRTYLSPDMTNTRQDDSLPSHYCEKCDMTLPYRTHHCGVCKKCILKKDHHCYIVGNCIGFKNQRYFVVFTFYIALNCSLAGILTFNYFRDAVWPDLSSWSDTLLPLTVVRYLFGNVDSLSCILIIHLYNEILFGILGIGYFTTQMVLCVQGMTLYEKAKRIRVVNNNNVSRNMCSVFGNCWALNFLVPMTPIFRQTEDGKQWPGLKLCPRLRQTKHRSNLYEDVKY